MMINEIKTEIRKIEKYYDFNHQTNDYDVLVNLTEIANLILLQNKISYNKAIDDFAGMLIRYVDCGHLCSPTEVRWSDLSVVEMVNKLAEQLKEGVNINEQS